MAFFVISFFTFLRAQTAGPGPKKPNIVFILVDNTGWGDLGVYGGTTATPRIDKLASEGIRFRMTWEGVCL
jgi:arylsulfatase